MSVVSGEQRQRGRGADAEGLTSGRLEYTKLNGNAASGFTAARS